MQVFYASSDTFTWPNGAVGHRPGGSFDCLGPFAKVKNCPIEDTDYRVTAYATGYAETWFSVPAVCKVKGKRIKGFFYAKDDGVRFIPYRY
jgi:hypothetical protein